MRGIAVGAAAVLGLGLAGGGLSRPVRLVSGLTSVCIACWLVAESNTLWSVFGRWGPLNMPALAVAGMFWLFVMTVFDDRPVSAWSWAPAAVLFCSGPVWLFLSPMGQDWLWAARNLFSGALAVHAGIVVVRGWTGDLMETRRRLRALVLGMSALFAILNVAIAFAFKLYRDDAWLQWSIGEVYGVSVFAVLMLASAAVFLQARQVVFGAPRRTGQGSDARAESAERLMLGKLNELMAAGGWRREGLTIGALATELGEPEHRLRRLINQRLDHRNFADFLNGFRIEAAKQRLADPREARTTVAAIAFDLGYGSLGPFNRAFREATDTTPTAWRQQALQTLPELPEAI
ncbi:helix-turn-helix domain-containing protein [Phenylobacterium sp.]|uniref:helix-turn-helix domain-containing protein n=1 Tax=Phenylobacterium sp. TaxID=1871053 RepID=UPI0025CCC1CA|nr:helix-turn-helix domain-containing protein [Phenylobacterium sp.]